VVIAGPGGQAVHARLREDDLHRGAHVVHRRLADVPDGGPTLLDQLVRHDVVVDDRDRAVARDADRLRRGPGAAVDRPGVAAADLMADDDRGRRRRCGAYRNAAERDDRRRDDEGTLHDTASSVLVVVFAPGW